MLGTDRSQVGSELKVRFSSPKSAIACSNAVVALSLLPPRRRSLHGT